MRAARVPVTLLLAGVLLLVVGAFTPEALRGLRSETPASSGRNGSSASTADSAADAALQLRDSASLDAGIAAGQRRLHDVPGDWVTWAELGSAYVQQARVTADPSYYPKAEGALTRSLAEQSTTNWAAMVGMGALANARHDFTAGLDWGRRAQKINPAGGSVYGVLADALTQLGDYAGARDATQHMLDVAPGVSSFTRASYDFEEHGQVDRARDALQQALAQASDPADSAYCRYYLGELAFNSGDLAGAATQYAAGIEADPAYQMLYAGLAKVHAAQDDTAGSLREYDRVVQLLPLPQLLIEYGDALAAAGQPDRAKREYDLLAVEQRLLRDNGVADHLTSAVFLADHGDPAQAVVQARQEWAARHSVLAADALSWALHRAGQDAEALGFATTATGLGWRNATFFYHRGMIQNALGHREDARRDLTDALAINPYFDLRQAPLAHEALAALERRA